MYDKSTWNPIYEDETGFYLPAIYVKALDLIERLHFLRLEIIKDLLRRDSQLNLTPTQALLLFRIGHKTLTPSEIANRGYCQRSNVSHHLKKLIEGDFLTRRRLPADRRSIMVSLTQRGADVFNIINDLFVRHADEITTCDGFYSERLDSLHHSLEFLEGYLSEELSLI